MKRIIIILSLCLFLLTTYGTLSAQSKADIRLQKRFEKQLNDPHLPDLLKRIFLDQEWRLGESNSESILLSMLDSLSSTNKETRLFYMIIAEKSEKHADGSYAEGLGYAGKEYVDAHLEEFVKCFLGRTALDSNQLAAWSNIVMGEVQIRSSSGDSTVFEKTISLYKKNSINFNKKEREVLDKFISIMKKEWEIVKVFYVFK